MRCWKGGKGLLVRVVTFILFVFGVEDGCVEGVVAW